MTGQRVGKILRRHARTIIVDADALDPAIFQRHIDRLGSGVQRILEHFLYHRCRTLHHFAGGDLADEGVGEGADGRHGE